MHPDVFAIEIGDMKQATRILRRWAGWQMPMPSEWREFIRERQP
jgi:hypothetical protein